MLTKLNQINQITLSHLAVIYFVFSMSLVQYINIDLCKYVSVTRDGIWTWAWARKSCSACLLVCGLSDSEVLHWKTSQLTAVGKAGKTPHLSSFVDPFIVWLWTCWWWKNSVQKSKGAFLKMIPFWNMCNVNWAAAPKTKNKNSCGAFWKVWKHCNRWNILTCLCSRQCFRWGIRDKSKVCLS